MSTAYWLDDGTDDALCIGERSIPATGPRWAWNASHREWAAITVTEMREPGSVRFRKEGGGSLSYGALVAVIERCSEVADFVGRL